MKYRGSAALSAIAALGLVITGSAVRAQDLLAPREWLLNPKLSNVYMQTVKNNSTFETHEFTAVEGSIDKNAEAKVRIDLASIYTNVDLRDVRMRFLLFETYKFPHAVVTAKIDRAKLDALRDRTRVAHPLKLTVDMHGFKRDIDTSVWVTRISDSEVSVSTIKPIIVTAESFGFVAGIKKLAEAVGDIPIATAASLSFDLMFGSGSLTKELGTARTAREALRAVEATRGISAQECETRFQVISKTGAIHFRSASAELDTKSAPLLTSVADIANRCPTVRIDVEGHTDSIGSTESNMRLSEFRAKSVVDFLTGKGVSGERIKWAGHGDTKPLAPNNSEANRARNRRIEFSVSRQ